MDRSTDKTYLFEQMPASQAVRRQILPAIASQMVLLAYNLADTYFVGLLNDPLQTAAVSVAYTITVLMTAIANLFAVGGASCMAGPWDGMKTRMPDALRPSPFGGVCLRRCCFPLSSLGLHHHCCICAELRRRRMHWRSTMPNG